MRARVTGTAVVLLAVVVSASSATATLGAPEASPAGQDEPCDFVEGQPTLHSVCCFVLNAATILTCIIWPCFCWW